MLSFSPVAFATEDPEPDFNALSKETGFTIDELKAEWEVFLDIKDHVRVDGKSGQIIFDNKGALGAGVTPEIIDKVQGEFEVLDELGILSNCGGINRSEEHP